MTETTQLRPWPDGLTRVPWVFQREDVYAAEQERLFRGPHWNFLCLEAELAEPGQYLEIGGESAESSESRVTEASVRGFWKAYLAAMGMRSEVSV
jgi:hypothetical protein